MAFTTPCFVRVEDAAERKKLNEWLELIGITGDEDWTAGDVVLCISDTSYCCLYEEFVFAADDTTIDCGTSIELFKALAAMNDENDREQWFVDKDGSFYHCGYDRIQRFIDISYLYGYDFTGDWLRKATAEEIVEYFKKREKCKR